MTRPDRLDPTAAAGVPNLDNTMSSAPHLNWTLVEAIARRVAELLRAERGPSIRWFTPSEVADRFGVSRSWVYEHAEDLGVVRLGAGPRARLRFDPSQVSSALRRATSKDPPGPDPGSVQDREDLLPVYGRNRQKPSTE